MTDADLYIQKLEESNPWQEPILREAIRALDLPRGSRGLDVGCGIGLPTLLLAEALGPEGGVTGLDVSAQRLHYAEQLVMKSALAKQISFREGDMYRLPYEDDSFDWLWSTDCAGYPVGELLPLLLEFSRVVKPGGSVAVLAWSSQQLLPGYPLLEARLNATCSSYIPYVRDAKPEANFLRALGWFRQVGLEDVIAQTFLGEVQAPLGEGIRVALVSLFEMLWDARQPETSEQDWCDFQRLCRPDSPDFILNLPDYYAFFSYTMFRGKVPGRG